MNSNTCVALHFLHVRFSNIRAYKPNGGLTYIKKELWDYEDEVDKDSKFPWWMHHHSLLSALMFYGVESRKPREKGGDTSIEMASDRGNAETKRAASQTNSDGSEHSDLIPLQDRSSESTVYVFSDENNTKVRVKLLNSSYLSRVRKVYHVRDNLVPIASLLGIKNPVLHDYADMIRWAVRDPEGPFVDTALLCWPETALYLLDYLRVDKKSEYAFFNEILPVRELEEAFPYASLDGWLKQESGRRRSKSFMTGYIKALAEDYGSNPEFMKELYDFICSLAELCIITIQLARNSEKRVFCPSHATSKQHMPTLPDTFEKSKAIQDRRDTTFAMLDIISALYIGAILAPQGFAELLSEQSDCDTMLANDDTPPIVWSRRNNFPKPLILVEYSFSTSSSRSRRDAGFDPFTLTLRTSTESSREHGSSSTERVGHPTGKTYFALPSQTIIMSRNNGKGSIAIKESTRQDIVLVTVDNRCVSDMHAEVQWSDGAWLLFDRRYDGKGSLNGTLLHRIKDNQSANVLLKKKSGGYVVASESLKSTFVITLQNMPSAYDRNDLVAGISLEEGDLIFLAPNIRSGRRTPNPDVTFYKVEYADIPIGNWIN